MGSHLPPAPIAIVGLGPVSTLGVGRDAFAAWAGAAARGETSWPATALDGFDVRQHVKLTTQCLDPASGLALAASALARRDAGWDAEPPEATRLGLVLGTAFGNGAAMSAYRELSKPSPLRFVHTFRNAPAGLTAQVLALRGVHSLLCSGPLASLQAIRYARHLLASHKADGVLCGGVDDVRAGQPGAGDAPDAPRAGAGAGVLALMRGEEAGPRVHAELAGSAVRCAAQAAPALVADAVRGAAEQSGIHPSGLGAVVLGCASGEPGKMQEAALRSLEIPEERWIDLAAAAGDTGAAHGGLAVIAATLLLRGEPGRRHVAVIGFHQGQCVAQVLRRASA